MPLGEPLAVAAQNRGKMRKLRHRPTQCLVKRDLLGSIGEMIVATYDVRDLHHRVINYHHVVVNRDASGAQDNGIAHCLAGKLNGTVHDIVKAYWMLRNYQPNGAQFSSSAPSLRFFRRNGATLS